MGTLNLNQTTNHAYGLWDIVKQEYYPNSKLGVKVYERILILEDDQVECILERGLLLDLEQHRVGNINIYMKNRKNLL